jgi:hypothetical protein
MNLRALGTWVGLLGCALATFAEPLKLVERQVNIPERGPVTGYLLSSGTNHFSFLPPPLWRTSHRPGANSVAIMSADGTTSIAIEFLSPKAEEPQAKSTLIKTRFPDAAIDDPFDCSTGLGPSIAYDLRRKAAGDIRLTSRVIYVFTPVAVIEFALTGPTAKFADHTTAFASVVNSFRAAGH